jgi:hypothetical protein
MPITAEEARLRAAGRAALPQVRPLGASRHDGSGDFLTSMFGSLSTNISTVASAVDPWVGESFALQGHGAQAATPIRSAAPSTPAAGFEVPEVPAPPAFVEDSNLSSFAVSASFTELLRGCAVSQKIVFLETCNFVSWVVAADDVR